MSAGKPIRIKVEYDDGTVKECNVEDLSGAVQRELRESGLITWSLKELNREHKLVLVEWRNGWKEVFSVPPDVTEVRNYYVIRRAEETGRLFLNRPEGYPELVEIVRKPKEVEKVTLV